MHLTEEPFQFRSNGIRGLFLHLLQLMRCGRQTTLHLIQTLTVLAVEVPYLALVTLAL